MEFQLESGLSTTVTLWLLVNYLVVLLILIGAVRLYFRVMNYLKLKIDRLEQ